MNNLPEDEYQAEDASVGKRIDLPLVWLLPIVALLVSVWLIYKAASEKGLVVHIDFPTAEGLDVDKTKIRYLDVDVGKVTAISINEDMKTIRVTAQMSSGATNFLKETTTFWVVKPQVGLSGVSGLSTLFSGSYIELKPGTGNQRLNFTGLTSPPVLKSEIEGKQYILESSNIGSIKPGTPINFLGIHVGEVLAQDLTDAANAIKLTIFINSPYDHFVRKNTKFWVDSGVDLSAGANGFKIRTGPLVSLLGGGIAFRASPKDSIADIKPENSVFPLYESYDDSTQITYTNTLKYVMHFKGSVRGLGEGAPVQLRGIPIGRVTDISLELDKQTAEIKVPVIVELEPDRIKSVNDNSKLSDEEIVEQLIKKGLRAQLQTGSLVTGQMLIDLDFYPDSKPITVLNHRSGLTEFPTMTSKLEAFSHSAQIIMDKLAKLPLDKLSEETRNSLTSLQDTAKATTSMMTTANSALATADKTLAAARQTLLSADSAIKSAQGVLGNLEPGSNGYYEFHKLLQELAKTSTSMKQLADYLEQHPESLLRGKNDEE